MIKSTHIKDGKRLLASVFYRVDLLSQSSFFTQSESSLQVGVQKRKKNSHIMAHIHPPLLPIKHNTYEVLYIIKGEMAVAFLTEKGKTVKKVTVQKGDLIIQYEGGHSFTFTKQTILFEVKPGPYIRGHIKINEKQINSSK